jgi:hypothetical protein
MHGCGGLANALGRTDRIGKQQAGVAVLAPQSPQCPTGQIGQWHQTILVPLATPDVHLFVLRIDIANFKRQCLTQAQAHRIGRQQKDPVTQFTCGADQLLDLGQGKNIR